MKCEPNPQASAFERWAIGAVGRNIGSAAAQPASSGNSYEILCSQREICDALSARNVDDLRDLELCGLAGEWAATAEPISSRRSGRDRQQCPAGRAARSGESGSLRYLDLEVRKRLPVTPGDQDLESGQDQADAR